MKVGASLDYKLLSGYKLIIKTKQKKEYKLNMKINEHNIQNWY